MTKKKRKPQYPGSLTPRLLKMSGRRAHLLRAVNLMVDNGRPPACMHPDGTARPAWTSEASATLRYARARCYGCPVIELCRTVGSVESSGVWGGVVRATVGYSRVAEDDGEKEGEHGRGSA